MAMCTAAATAVAGLMLVVLPAPAAAAASSAGAVTAYQAPGTPSPSVAGASTPSTTYQAPEATLGGGASAVSLTSSPTSEYDSPQGEATGHAYVQLTGTGQSVQWTNDTGQSISFINERASIPDSTTGGGLTNTLDFYVNGVFRQAPSCTAAVTFAPTAAGTQSGALTVTAGGVTSTTTLSGTGTAPGPVLTASPGGLTFPSEVVGTAAPTQTITVTNSGTTSATVAGVTVSGPYSETNNCSTLAVDGSCTVTVGFTPSTAGANPGTLTITSNATDTPTTAALSGNGISLTTDLASAGTLTAGSTESGFPASNANDGNTSTYWESSDGAGYPQTLTANLCHPCPAGDSAASVRESPCPGCSSWPWVTPATGAPRGWAQPSWPHCSAPARGH